MTIDMKARCCPEENQPTLPRSADEQLALLANALGHPARVTIVRLLKERESCICGEIVEVLPLAQSTVSQHLKVLKEAGWIQGEVDGARTCYCLNTSALERFGALIQDL